MKVLFIARPDLYINTGGDTIQLVATAKYLTKLGVLVDINISPQNINYNNYDLLHFFNVIDPEDILGHVLKSKKPYVVSTIYVDYSEFDKNYRKGLVGFLAKILPTNSIEYLKTLAKFLIKGEQVSTPYFFLKGHKKSIQYILKNASCLLPNSQSEYNRLVKDFGVTNKYAVIPNAIDTALFQHINDSNIKDNNLVICVARMEGLKNQLNLIKAVANTNIQLLIIGKESPNQKKYADECKKIATNNVKFLPFIEQSELLLYYAKAKVHVLPSWFETTGLCNLEAAAMGCNIVIANKGDVKEYFNDFAFYCDPASPISIEEAIIKALNEPVSSKLRQRVLENYNWEITAKKTLDAYKKTLHDKL